MNRDTKIGHLNFAGLLATHLQDDIVQLEHKVLQTTKDINNTVERLEAIKQAMDDIHEDEDHEGLAIAAMDGYAASVNHLSITLVHLEHKRAVFNLSLNNARSASVALNSFANAIPGIPTSDE